MGNDTKVTTMALGGALAILVLVFAEPWILRFRGGVSMPMGVEGALTILFGAALAYVLPSDVMKKISRRTKSTPPLEPPK